MCVKIHGIDGLKATVRNCKEYRVIRVKWGGIIPKHGFNRKEYERDGAKLLSAIGRAK